LAKKRESEEEMEDSGMEGKRQKLKAESPENALKEKNRKLLEEQMVIDAELLRIKTIKNAALIEQNKLLAIERQKRAPEKKAFELLNELKKKLDEAVKNTKMLVFLVFYNYIPSQFRSLTHLYLMFF
jgi:hypothetical protein